MPLHFAIVKSVSSPPTRTPSVAIAIEPPARKAERVLAAYWNCTSHSQVSPETCGSVESPLRFPQIRLLFKASRTVFKPHAWAKSMTSSFSAGDTRLHRLLPLSVGSSRNGVARQHGKSRVSSTCITNEGNTPSRNLPRARAVSPRALLAWEGINAAKIVERCGAATSEELHADRVLRKQAFACRWPNSRTACGMSTKPCATSKNSSAALQHDGAVANERVDERP
jgi:hypothetical protein